MLDLLTPGHHSHSTTDLFIQVATLAGGLLIAAALKYMVDVILHRRRARQKPPGPAIP